MTAGITAIGANCFNMAILGSLTAYGVYRLVAGGAAIESPRRVFAAGLAGYLAINLSALAAAIELGLQPLLYRDAAGAALYAPYPLRIAIPAMMAGHLTVAGLAEMVLSGGVVAYLQRFEPGLLRAKERGGAFATKPLWVALAMLAVLTPLGILAAGSAWGEWSVEEFAQAPAGMQSLAHVWSAPFAKYAPPFLKNGAAGYVVSALLGMAVIAGVCLLLRRRGFIERTLKSLLRAAEYAAGAEKSAEAGGVLQRVDPRVKVVGLMVLVVVVAASHRLEAIGGIFALALALALLSGIGLGKLASWVWIPVLLFTGAIALPAIVLVPQGAAQRGVFDFAGGDGGYVVGAAGADYAVAFGAEGAAGFEVSYRCGRDSGDDLSLHF